MQSQFYCEGLGWIPNDTTVGVKNNNPNFKENDEGAYHNFYKELVTMTPLFGADAYPFVTFTTHDEVTINYSKLGVSGGSFSVNFQRFSFLKPCKLISSSWEVNKR